MKPARLRTLSLVALACAAVLIGGCGGDDGDNSNDAGGNGQTDDQQVRAVSTAYNSALLAGYEGRADYEKLCSLLTAALKLEVARETDQQTHESEQCQEGWKILLESVNSFADSKAGKLRFERVKAAMRRFKIRSVRIRGNKATVTSTASFVDGEGGPTYLRKEDGKWLVDKQPAQAPQAPNVGTQGSDQNGG